MTKMQAGFFVTICSLVVLMSCGSAAKLYEPDHPKRIYSGTLDDAANASVRQLLASRSPSPLKDTVIIKYDYNNSACWSMLDEKDDTVIRGFITRHRQRVSALQSARPGVSVFNFREPGSKVNKIKKWDDSVLVDSSGQLMALLFRERSVCGNSIIILPDKRFVFIRSDPHSEAFDPAQDKIVEYLQKK